MSKQECTTLTGSHVGAPVAGSAPLVGAEFVAPAADGCASHSETR